MFSFTPAVMRPVRFFVYGDTRDELPDFIMDVIARIKERQEASRRAKRHVLKGGAKFVDVDVGIFENALHQVNCTNIVT